MSKTFKSGIEQREFIDNVAKTLLNDKNAKFAFCVHNTGSINIFSFAISLPNNNDMITYKCVLGTHDDGPPRYELTFPQIDAWFYEAYPEIMLRGNQTIMLDKLLANYSRLNANDIYKTIVYRLKYGINKYHEMKFYEIQPDGVRSIFATTKYLTFPRFEVFEEFAIWVQMHLPS